VPTIAADGSPDFQRELLVIATDPTIMNLARRWARNDQETAEDAVQATYGAVARVKDPAVIENLRAYFCRALQREVNRLHGQLGAALMEDFSPLVDAHQDRADAGLPVSRPYDEVVVSILLVEGYLEALAARKQALNVKVPGRSPDPDRYRSVIAAAAEWVLRACLICAVSNADCSEALRAAYPDWFAEPGCAQSTYHQRFCRARLDVRVLLRTIVNRDEL